jgi:hypothetical protein
MSSRCLLLGLSYGSSKFNGGCEAGLSQSEWMRMKIKRVGESGGERRGGKLSWMSEEDVESKALLRIIHLWGTGVVGLGTGLPGPQRSSIRDTNV